MPLSDNWDKCRMGAEIRSLFSNYNFNVFSPQVLRDPHRLNI